MLAIRTLHSKPYIDGRSINIGIKALDIGGTRLVVPYLVLRRTDYNIAKNTCQENEREFTLKI
jgi:hypothetical protein